MPKYIILNGKVIYIAYIGNQYHLEILLTYRLWTRVFTILVGRIYAAYFLFQTPMLGFGIWKRQIKTCGVFVRLTVWWRSYYWSVALHWHRQYDSKLFSSSRQQSAVCSQVYDLCVNKRRTAQQLVVIYLVLPIFAMPRRWFTHAPRKVDFFDIFIFNNH